MTTVQRAEVEAASGGTPAIEVRNLTMMYGQLLIMEDLSFSVKQGEVFVIMGGSGSGKSTLLKHLIGLKDPAEGTILFHGEDFGAADAEGRPSCGSRCRSWRHRLRRSWRPGPSAWARTR